MRSGAAVVSAVAPGFAIALGDEAGPGGRWHPGLAVLRGPPREALFPDARPAGSAGPFSLFRAPGRLVGAASLVPDGSLEAETRRLYATLLEHTRGLHLCRIWNYVPGINAPGPDGVENYRAFSAGRSRAFEAALGPGFAARLPAASAVGATEGRLSVLFVASERPVRHAENALQVPAYEYPPDYGPRAPSFARATLVDDPDGSRDGFISGTAAIRGHRTMDPGDTLAQLRCTIENLREISRACGFGDDLAAGRARLRHAKAYLRHARDLEAVAAELDAEFRGPRDHVTFLEAGICRACLEVEIEVSVFGVR